jgi:hypothetical protein
MEKLILHYLLAMIKTLENPLNKIILPLSTENTTTTNNSIINTVETQVKQ